LTLGFLGLLGLLFFWMTDPNFGPAGGHAADGRGRVDWRHWLFVLRGSPDNIVEAANQLRVSTIIGLAGSLAVLLVGLWLVTRRLP
jgi:hypothetical protein